MLPSSSAAASSPSKNKQNEKEDSLSKEQVIVDRKYYENLPPPSFKQMSEFCRNILMKKSGATFHNSNAKLIPYRGFPSIYHAETFFMLVSDRLGCMDCHSFLDRYEIIENPSKENDDLMRKIKKKSLDQLQNLIKSKQVNVSILDTGSSEQIKRIPFVVVHGRYSPPEAAFLLLAWCDYLVSVLEKFKLASTETDQFLLSRIELVNRVRKALSWRVSHKHALDLQKYMKDQKITEFSSSSISNKVSFMNDKFKPIISLPKIDIEKINKILKDAELPTVNYPRNLSEYNSLLDTLEELAGVNASSISFRLRNRKNSKPTKTAVYSPQLNHQTRKTNLHSSLWHFRKYNKLLDICGRIRGRLCNVSHPYITGVATRIDKSGMTTFIFKDEHYMFDETSYESIMNDIDVPSVVFVAMAVSLFSVRKEFTLNSQIQGKLDPFLVNILDICRLRNEKTRWDLIASVYPMEDIVSNLSGEGKLKLLSNFLDLQIPMAFFLQKQYDIGVKYCIEKGMSVPRSGSSSVDSTGYNAVVGAWNNSIRFIRMITKTLNQPPPMLLKCMKLTAADQMKMFSMYGRGEHADVALFVELVKKGITPWGIIIGNCSVAIEDLIKLCKKFKIDPNTWLGYTNYRVSDDFVFNELICGCVIPNTSIAQSILKKLNAYGYKPHKSIKKK
ncbi:predicted protein [Naegleria gruberi]|uniref:Predicted protein n=1 Tax=Naegleria gruberi TaxID=5762 RepID=D2W3D0_NAEGR|nr:uncharacterized protein NAEGRDRAFT_75902 [Naegleria gruberi]EFC36369.1 predicted protein [Naegleria gruberi]|eukprot:XP_002669113.1 predicted protein [Naegleria gruberi strain NEG-M]